MFFVDFIVIKNFNKFETLNKSKYFPTVQCNLFLYKHYLMFSKAVKQLSFQYFNGLMTLVKFLIISK